MSTKTTHAKPEQSPSRVPQYSVKDVSEMTGISIYALRYYDKLALFPHLQRGENNSRLFSEAGYAVSSSSVKTSRFDYRNRLIVLELPLFYGKFSW